MFIGFYKGVQSSREFYSEERNDLNFPTQVSLDGERYLLNKTIQISSQSQYDRLITSATGFGVRTKVKIS
jgi:hypothetical protein